MENITVAKLKALCRQRGVKLPSKANKADIIKALQSFRRSAVARTPEELDAVTEDLAPSPVMTSASFKNHDRAMAFPSPPMIRLKSPKHFRAARALVFTE